MRLSRGFELKMGLFSRLAQSTYLLSQVLNSTSSPPGRSSTPDKGEETAQLRRTLLALVKLADMEASVRQLQFCSQSSICYR